MTSRFWSIIRVSPSFAILRVTGNIGIPDTASDINETREQNLTTICRELVDVIALDVFFNCKGGHIKDAFAIHDILEHLPAKKVAFIQGWCGSAATVIALACDKVLMDRAARFAIHEPQLVLVGGHTEILRKALEARDLAEPLVDLYSAKTKRSPEEIRAAMAAGLNMSAAEAKEMGFVDEIVYLPAGMIPDDPGNDDFHRLLDDKCLRCAFAWAGADVKNESTKEAV